MEFISTKYNKIFVIKDKITSICDNGKYITHIWFDNYYIEVEGSYQETLKKLGFTV